MAKHSEREYAAALPKFDCEPIKALLDSEESHLQSQVSTLAAEVHKLEQQMNGSFDPADWI